MRPGRRASARRLRLPGTGAAALLAAGLLSPAAAQQGGPPAGLPLLAFDLSPRLESSLDGDAPLATVGLGLSFLDATPVETLSLSATGSLQAGGSGDADTFTGPVLRFGYDRTAADAGLTLGATLRRDEVEDLADLSGFVDDNGVIVLPPDFDLLSGTGIRREATASAALSLRQGRPLSYGLSAAVTDIAYEDAESDALVDSRRLSLGLSATATLAAQRTVTAGLRYSALDEEAQPLSESWGLDLGASAGRPRGPLTASLSLDRTPDGTRAAASLGRTLTFPTGSLSGSLGVARGDTGELSPTLTLALQRNGANDSVRLSATQALRSGRSDEEELATTLSADYARTLSPRTDLSLGALFAATEPTGSGDPSRAVELTAGMTYRLTQDWAMDGGLRGRLSDDGTDTTRTTTLFVGLSRRFQGTF